MDLYGASQRLPPPSESGPSGQSSPTIGERPDDDFEKAPSLAQTPDAGHSRRSSVATGEQQHVDLEKTPSPVPEAYAPSTALDTVLSRVPSGPDPGPAPDGGLRAWFQVFIGHLAILNAWGYIQTWGVFQTYYVTALNRPPSDIAWIGSFQIFSLFFFGTFSGRVTDAGYFRAVFLAGSGLELLGIFMTSIASQYWELFLAQGVCQGLANGLLFCAIMSVVSSYFSRNRALACAAVATGTSTGGMIYPAMVEALLPRIGFGWTVRAIGLVMLVVQATAVLGARPRLRPRRAGPFLDAAAFREPAFMLFIIGMFFALWAWFIAFYFVGSYSRNALGADGTFATNQLLVMNGMGIPGRLIPALLADRVFGHLNVIVVCTACTAVLLCGWPGVTSLAGVWAFSPLYGLFASGILGLFPAVLGVLTPMPSKIGVRMGMAFTFVSLACLTGAPISGALLQRGEGSYLPPQIFAIVSMLLATGFLAVARISQAGCKLWVRV